ncbi:unnamed protein product [Auanema sp. JU1783]|nr:unnamed protein product [Auanema sp. JU1783]
MPGVARDDIASFKLRSSGTTIVCAAITNLEPLTIRDNSGTYEILNFTSRCNPVEGDVGLFLFNCSSSPATCERLTVIHPDIVPVYLAQMRRYKEEFN